MSDDAAVIGGNGVVSVPAEEEFEDTGRVSRAFHTQLKEGAAAMAGHGEIGYNPDQFIDTIAKKLIEHGSGGGGGGGVPPEVHKKQIKRHNWIAVIMAAILGPGGALTVIYATSDRSKANSMKIEQVEKLEPRVKQTEEDVRYIKASVKGVSEKVDTAMVQQTAIAAGIEELKDENVNRLKEELDEAKRELRRRPRRVPR